MSSLADGLAYGPILFALLGITVVSRSCAADESFDWSVSGQNVLRSEWYTSDGDTSNSAYSDRGHQIYDEIGINFDRRLTPFHQVRGYLSGVFSDSPYRSPHQGGTLERFNITQENGESRLPYRLEVGDYYGYYTPRTLQQSLKGAQIDIQPTLAWFGATHSVQTHLGGIGQDYHSDISEDRYVGGSWLMDWHDQQLSLNYSHNRRAADGTTGTNDLGQAVFGIAYHRDLELGGQQLAVDAEFDRFHGDPLATGPLAGTRPRAGLGRFFQLQGSSELPLSYALSLEDNDRWFVPNGAAVSADRLASEARMGWRFDQGMTLQGRHQFYRDAQHSANPTDTRVWGANLSGGIPTEHIPGLNMSLDTFIQRTGDRAVTTRTEARAVSTYFSAPLRGLWTGGVQLGYQAGRNRLTDTRTDTTRQIGIDLGHPIGVGGFRGSANGGVSWREVRIPGGGNSNEPGFNLATYLTRGRHELEASVRYQGLFRLAAGVEDVQTDGISLAYQYAHGPHTIRIDTDVNRRDPSVSQGTNDYRLGLSYTFDFDRPARTPAMVNGADYATASATTELPFSGRSLVALAPGVTMAQAEVWLQKASIGAGVDMPGARVYDTPFYAGIDQRQRLVLLHDELGQIEGSAVLIDIRGTGALESMEQLYRRLQAMLVRRYGNPVVYEKGVFGPGLTAELAADRFVRISEWSTPSGTLRLGIPRRTDRVMRIEVHLRSHFPDYRDTRWGLNSIR